MYSEEFINYLLRYQTEPRKEPGSKARKRVSSNDRPHFGYIYAKMMKKKYAMQTLNVR